MAATGLAHRAISIDEFMPMLGQTLLADCNPRTAELLLVKIEPCANRGSARVPFTLIFRSADGVQLVGGMYPLRCGEFGPALVHIEPVTPPADLRAGNYYQALFN